MTSATMGPVGAQEALAFLALPEVQERLDDDDRARLEAGRLPDDAVVLGAHVPPGELFGVAVLCPFRDGWSIHFYTRRQGRRQWARAFGRAVVAAVTAIGPAYVQIPVVYPAVVNFARRLGFERVDVEPGAYLKDGRRHDREVLRCLESSVAVAATQARPRQSRPQHQSAGSICSGKTSHRSAPI